MIFGRKRKQVLETFSNVSLDPNTQNYIEKMIGSQYWTVQQGGGTDPYLQLTGDYPNKSKHVRVEVVPQHLTVDYLDENGEGSKIDHMKLDKNGRFINKWRHGFFSERLDEI